MDLHFHLSFCQPSLLLSLPLSAGALHFYLISYLPLPVLLHLEPPPRGSCRRVGWVAVLPKPAGDNQGSRTGALGLYHFGEASWKCLSSQFSGYCKDFCVVRGTRHRQSCQNIFKTKDGPIAFQASLVLPSKHQGPS